MIINNLALIVNNFVISLYAQNIPFYMILIGLFIFNAIIYIICSMIRQSRYLRY